MGCSLGAFHAATLALKFPHIFNFSLGSTQLKLPSVMINLLGEPGHEGMVKYEGLTSSMRIEGVKVHLYGKKETTLNRNISLSKN